MFFPVNFNDVDFCLRLRELGKRIILTPHARLLHLESVSRGRDTSSSTAPRLARELRALRARWGETLADDPLYSPVLSLDPLPFSGLAWPPRSRSARVNSRPRARALPPGL
jgi:GT2 family glycosyltransferase